MEALKQPFNPRP
ncbi:putative outer membrane receptor domain protein, partial [Vibrio parahaemolyticus AQ3810]